MDHLGRPALADRHVQRVEDQLGPEMRRHRPADHPAAPGVEDDGEVQEAGPGRDVRDVGHPQPIGAVGGEGPLDEIRGRPGGGIAAGGGHEGAPAHAGQAGGLHEAGDALAADVDALGRQFRVHAGRAVRPAGAVVDRPDLLE